MGTQWTFDFPTASGKFSGGSAAEYGFQGRIDTLVRETIQNSMDAALDESKPVDVRYRLIELTGEDVETFLGAIHWDELEEHLESVPSSSTGGQEVLKAVHEFQAARSHHLHESPQSLRILVIEDRNTKGLKGGEYREKDESENPYRALAFDELISDKPDENAAGSFGLGKIMLWVFSRFKTVLFSSVPLEPPEHHEGLRTIGRTSLPAHWVGDQQFTGDGWFGESDEERAFSEWGSQAHKLARFLQCDREDGEFGTSIAIVGFREPNAGEERALEDLAYSIRESSVESFWPAMSMGMVSVSVQVERESETILDLEADPATLEGFSTAQALYDLYQDGGLQEVDRLFEKGESGYKQVTLSVPERIYPPDKAHEPFEIKFPVIVRLLKDSEVNERVEDRIFRFRYQGMLVGREQKGQLSVTARPFVAVLPAGLAAGSDEYCRRADQFLRAAEPQEHDRWTHRTKAISNNYNRHGIATYLNRFESDIKVAIREMISIPERAGGMLPNQIRALFKFGNSGGGNDGDFVRVTYPKAEQCDEGWKFSFRCRRLEEVKREWQVRVRLFLVADGGKADLSKSLDSVDCDEAKESSIIDGKAILRFGPGVDRAVITGVTDPTKFSTNARRAALDIRVDGWEVEEHG